MLAAALASNATTLKNVCLNLESIPDNVLFNGIDPAQMVRCPDVSTWRRKLMASSAVGEPGDYRPLILDDMNKLYLHRYWKYEHLLAHEILGKVKRPDFDVDPNRLFESLDRFFSGSKNADMRPYQTAIITASFKRFCVITGGPGTGKTTTATKLLAALLEQPGGEKLRIALAAPTGKSAIRLGESVRAVKGFLDCPANICKAIPSEPQTIHRLLKPLSRSSYSFFYRHERPLPMDVVVVDEASMVDLALMSKLFQAVPRDARIILIGDRDQLASVEAGSVFGDICDGYAQDNYSEPWRLQVEAVLNKSFIPDDSKEDSIRVIGDCIVNLERSFRFEDNAGIKSLCRSVQRGDAKELMRLLNAPDYPELQYQQIDLQNKWIENLERNIIRGYREYLRAPTPQIALENLNRFKILCAIKKGPFGTEGVNRRAERILRKAGLLRPDAEWYWGKPVLITQNDYQLGLFNGDVGIVWNDAGTADEPLFVYFFSPTGEVRRIPPYRLPVHETAYALTVHKSQGSEFESVILLLPDHDSAVITRELLYTGVSRARNQVAVWGTEKIINAALSRTTRRNSGLRDMLWN